MATKAARAKSILTALLDAEPTTAQSNRVLDAFALAYAPESAATMTTAEKAGVSLRAVRAFVRENVQGVEVQQAQAIARQSIQPPDLGTD